MSFSPPKPNLTVVCVLRSGGDYDEEYVYRLQEDVERYLPVKHDFLCLSDVELKCRYWPLDCSWPGWWSKMCVFRPWLNGDVLYFDLDTMIVGDLTDIANVKRLTAVSDFYRPGRLQSCMMYLPFTSRGVIWKEWMKDPHKHMDTFRGAGDQGFLEKVWGRVDFFQDMLPGQVVSYKVDVVDKGLKEHNRVVCFHGKPRPRDVGWKLGG